MGAEESRSVPISPPPPDFEYFILGLSNYISCSKVRTIFGNQTDLSIIRDAIFQQWGQEGIEMEKPKLEQSWAFKIKGFPFTRGTGSIQAACARKMVCQILQNLNNAGLELKITSDLSRLGDLTTFYFCRSQVPRIIQYPLLCVGLSSTNKLQLVNTPDNILAIIKDIIIKYWGRGIQSEGPTENSYEFKLYGNPWFSQGDETVQARLLLVLIISALAQQHWAFHATANMKSTSDNLFFKYDQGIAGPLVNQHFIISLNRTDRLRLINAPQEIIPVVHQTIISTWTVMGGIQKEQDYCGSWEFKLSGNPWWSYGNEAVMARFLICKTLEALRGHGWDVKTSIDISRSSQDKSVLVFAPSQHPVSTPVMCLSFSDTDKIRLINAPQDLIGVCRDILTTRWYKGIQMEEQLRTSCNAYEFKMNGNPWHGTFSSESLHIRSVLCYFLQAFTARGWKYLTSADVPAKCQKQGENGPTYSVDVHSWWFAYEPGAPAAQPPPPFMPSSVMPPPPSYDQAQKQ